MGKFTDIGGTEADTPSYRVKPSWLNDNYDLISELIEGSMVQSSQLAYEQVKADSSSWTNTDYLGADIFTDSNGAKNTIDTGNSTGIYDGDYYILGYSDEASGDTTHNPNSFSDPENAFDDDNGTYAEKTASGDSVKVDVSLGKTFSSKNVKEIYIKVAFTGIANAGNADWDHHIYLQKYNGSSWSTIETLATASYDDLPKASSRTISYTGTIVFDKSTEGIRIRYEVDESNGPQSHSAKLYSLEYGQYDTSSTVETNTIINEVVPKSVVVYGKTDLPTDTSITVDVSDDGGTTWSLTDKELKTAIDTSTFTTGNLALKFNLATTDTSETPKLYGYSVAICDA
jgi:hypothetical protein